VTDHETLYGVIGEYRPCTVCEAPVVSPFPNTWTIDMIKEGFRWGPVRAYYTPHAEQCDAPMPTYAEDTGVCVRIPGHYVASINIEPPPVPRTPPDPGYLYAAPTGGTDWWTGWTQLGWTTDGVQLSEPPVGDDQHAVYWQDGVWPVRLDPQNGDVTE